MNKKLLSYLLTFVLLLLPVSVTVASAAPAANAPVYTAFIANYANDAELDYTGAGFTNGKFALTLKVTNAEEATGGTFVIKYDTTKVKPLSFNRKTPLDATVGSKTFFPSYNSDYEFEIDTVVNGMYVDGSDGYVYANWIPGGLKKFEPNKAVAAGLVPDIGTFAFETLDGVTTADFNSETFTVVTDVLPAGHPIRTGLASTGTPLTCNVKIDGVATAFGISDAEGTRESMKFVFDYPNCKVKPEVEEPETFDVVFMANDTVIDTITKEVGETVTVAEFPKDVVAPEGYTFVGWNVTEDITVATTVNAVFEKIDTTPRTVSDVTKDGTTCKVTTDLLYIPEGAVILVAGYNGKEMVAFAKVNYTKAQEIFNLAAEVEIEKVKVMVWANTSATAAPITIAEVK